MALVELKAKIPAGSVDVVDHVLLDGEFQHWSVLEDAVGHHAWLIGILPSEAEAHESWTKVKKLLQAAGVQLGLEPAMRQLGDADWHDSFKIHFHAWQFDRLHWVPVWERETFKLPPGDSVLWLDPGLAFGTGNHETTRLCVERLVTLAEECGVQSLDGGASAPAKPKPKTQNSKPRQQALRVIDAGCGSGILALSAALLGFHDVVGFDNDPEAIRVSQENAVLNGLADRVTFFVGDLTTGLAGKKADILLANIQADVLIRHAHDLVAAIAPGGALVLSGILASENSEVRTAFEKLTPNWTINARVMDAWSDLVLTRPD